MAEYTGGCFWWGALSLNVYAYVIGLICFAAFGYVKLYGLLRFCGVSYSFLLVSLPANVSSAPVENLSSIYGPLLAPVYTTSNPEDIDIVDKLVHKWTRRAGRASLVYALFWFAIATTHAMYYTGLFESFASAVLFACKFIVAYCAHIWKRHISSRLDVIAGKCITVVVVSNALAASVLIIQTVGYLVGTAYVNFETDNVTPSRPDFCGLLLIYAIGNTFHFACGTSQAVAFWIIRKRAQILLGDLDLYSDLANRSLGIFLNSSFAVGLALYFSSLAIFAGDWDNLGIRLSASYLLGTTAQLLVGVSMLRCNNSMQEYFRTGSTGSRNSTHGASTNAEVAGAVIGYVVQVEVNTATSLHHPELKSGVVEQEGAHDHGLDKTTEKQGQIDKKSRLIKAMARSRERKEKEPSNRVSTNDLDAEAMARSREARKEFDNRVSTDGLLDADVVEAASSRHQDIHHGHCDETKKRQSNSERFSGKSSETFSL